MEKAGPASSSPLPTWAGDIGVLFAHLKSIFLDTSLDRLWSGGELSVRPMHMTVVGCQNPHPSKLWVYKAPCLLPLTEL